MAAMARRLPTGTLYTVHLDHPVGLAGKHFRKNRFLPANGPEKTEKSLKTGDKNLSKKWRLWAEFCHKTGNDRWPCVTKTTMLHLD